MKKLIVSAALALALSANAATVYKTVAVNTLEVAQQQKFSKIDKSELPASITKELNTKYAGYAITAAYATDDKSEYKIELANDTKKQTVYYSSTGEFIKEEA